MVKLTIDHRTIDVPQGTTVLQAAQQLGIEVPVFCYHPRLAIAGNCRMCLVEMEKSPKPIASCAMPAIDGMVIHTTTPMVHKARQGVLEFLLINHPLDCPICDQGGECDLQDITVAYGPSTSRFQENKRAVSEKFMGPLIKTFMNRCIHCTRCIRFSTEIAGVPDMGTIGRGEDMEIISYLDQAIGSELSGNLVDICPVGALTSRPYSFKGRPWDLVKTDSIDVMDAVGSHIRIDTYGMNVIRILPRLCEDINEEWISDKTRHACDGLSQQRLDQPYVRRHGKLEAATWAEAFSAIKSKLSSVPGIRIAALAGDMVDVESMLALKDTMTALGSPHLDCRQGGEATILNQRSSYLFNTTIAGIERADACLIIDSALRHEAPLVQARLRKRYLQGQFSAAYIGGALSQSQEFTWPVENLGDDPSLLDQLLSGDHDFARTLAQSVYPMIIVGQSALRRSDGAVLLAKAQAIAQKYDMIKDDWNGFNVVQQAAARIGGLDIGFTPGSQGQATHDILTSCQKGEIDVVYLLGVDEIEADKFGTSFVIYQGHHGDRGAHRADVILPGAAYTEKNATYINLEGRVQQTRQALLPPGQAKEDWRIVRALATNLGITLPYQNLIQIRAAMAQVNSIFKDVGHITPAVWEVETKPLGTIDSTSFAPHSANFYSTDPISRSSKTMATCQAQYSSSNDEKAMHHG